MLLGNRWPKPQGMFASPSFYAHWYVFTCPYPGVCVWSPVSTGPRIDILSVQPNIQLQMVCRMHTLFSVNPLMQVCMYVFVCVYTCVHACIHIHVEVCLYPQTCGRVTASLFKVPTFHVFLMQNLSLIWNLLSRLSSQASEPQDPPGSVYSMMRLYSHNTMPGF